MTDKQITFGQLQRVLARLGYAAENGVANGVVFRHPKRRLFIILPRMKPETVVEPIYLLSVRNTLANSGVIDKEEFEMLFGPLGLWHAIIDAEAEYHEKHGEPPHVLRLPVVQAYDLAKLSRKELGPVSEQVMRHGVKAFEDRGLLNIKVQLVRDTEEFVFE